MYGPKVHLLEFNLHARIRPGGGGGNVVSAPACAFALLSLALSRRERSEATPHSLIHSHTQHEEQKERNAANA